MVDFKHHLHQFVWIFHPITSRVHPTSNQHDLPIHERRIFVYRRAYRIVQKLVRIAMRPLSPIGSFDFAFAYAVLPVVVVFLHQVESVSIISIFIKVLLLLLLLLLLLFLVKFVSTRAVARKKCHVIYNKLELVFLSPANFLCRCILDERSPPSSVFHRSERCDRVRGLLISSSDSSSSSSESSSSESSLFSSSSSSSSSSSCLRRRLLRRFIIAVVQRVVDAFERVAEKREFRTRRREKTQNRRQTREERRETHDVFCREQQKRVFFVSVVEK